MIFKIFVTLAIYTNRSWNPLLDHHFTLILEQAVYTKFLQTKESLRGRKCEEYQIWLRNISIDHR